MQSTDTLNQIMLDLLANDAASFAPAALALKAHLIKEQFAPGFLTRLADLEAADFPGSTPLLLDLGPPLVARNPLTGKFTIYMADPPGGYLWITTGLTNLPQTIWGVVLTNNGGTETYGSELLAEPVNLTEIGQPVLIGSIKFELDLGGLQ